MDRRCKIKKINFYFLTKDYARSTQRSGMLGCKHVNTTIESNCRLGEKNEELMANQGICEKNGRETNLIYRTQDLI